MLPAVLRNRPFMLTALVLGVLVGAFAPYPLRAVPRALVGWDVFIWSYMMMMWVRMVTAQHDKVRRIAMRDDENATVVLTLICMATVASVAAIAFELTSAKNVGLRVGLGHYAVTGATMFGAWFLIPTLFTLHYARIYYQSPPHQRALQFPDEGLEPNYWDFLYFSFTIAVASQTADICARGTPVRRAMLAQSIMSFYFNLAVLGLSINVAASLFS